MADAPAFSTDAKPRRPRRWTRRLLWFMFFLVVLLIVSPLALAIGPVRDAVADKIGDAVGRRVTIGDAFAFWGHGIDLEDVTVESPKGFDGPLATIEKIHAKIDLLALAGGTVDASVEVTKPHVTLRRNARNAGNTDDLFVSDEDEPATKSGARPRIHLVVTDGTIESVPTGGASGSDTGRIEDLNLAVLLAGDGGTSVTLRATAVGAQVGGADAEISASIGLDGNGAGPIEFATPPLDLGRLAALVEGASGVSNLTGQLQATGKASVQRVGEDYNVDGHIDIDGERIAALGGDDVRVSLAKLVAHIGLSGDGTRTTGDLRVTAEQFQVGRQTSTAPAYAEPRIQLNATGSFDAAAETIEIKTGGLTAGRTAAVDLREPWRVSLSPMRAVGIVGLHANLAQLARLSPLVPALEKIRGGGLNFGIRGNDADGLDLSLGAEVTNLTFDAGGSVVREPKVLAQARWRSVEDDVSRLDVYSLTSSAVSLTSTSTGTPFVLHLRDSGPSLDGPLGMRVDLGALSDLLGGVMGLEPGERMTGSVVVTGEAKGDDKRSSANAHVKISALTLPASWLAFRRPGTLDFDVSMSGNPGDTRIRATNLVGMGHSGQITARLSETDGETNLSEAILDLDVDLAQAQPYVGSLLGVETGGRLQGVAKCDLRLITNGNDRTASGFVVGREVVWQRTGLDPVLPKQTVRVDLDATMRPEGGRHVAKKLSLALDGLQIDLSGSTFGTGDDDDIDVRARITGDAARLAPSLAAYLGSDYADLRGRGPIDGSGTFGGSTGDNGRDLELDLTLSPGSWTTSGLRIENPSFSARRTGTSAKLVASLESKLNGGNVRLSAQGKLGEDFGIPWDAVLTARQVDTSGWVTGKGPARFLLFALPAIVPANSSSPALSGLLDAELKLASTDISDPALMHDLVGDGEVHMREGTVQDSTLFRGLGGGRGLGQVGKILAVTVPEVGSTLTSVSKALSFTKLDSEFNVGRRVVTLLRTELDGPVLSLSMTGTVDFDKRLDLVAKPRFLGGVGKKLSKVVPTAVIPLRVQGKIGDAKVTPALSMTDLSPGALEGVGDIGKKAKDKLKDLIGGGK